MVDASSIRERYAAVGRGLNERSRRLFAAAEARTAGYGGISATARATGIARSTIGRGLKDLDDPDALSGVVRRPGSGRRALTAMDATLLEGLRRLLEPATKGDPMRPLLWVSKSHAKLAAALCAMGHRIAKSSIPKLLGLLQYRRQVNRKTLEGSRNPDRDAQFEHINAAVIAAQAAGQPVISVDTKKKELIGPYKNGGSDYRPEGCPDRVNVHDFVDDELGKVVPYGVYDITANAGWVSVGIDNDTAQFSVNSIRRWLDVMGRERYPTSDQLMITADGGGSNGSRVRLFKVELQKLADDTGLTLRVCHYPPGTSKWNRIEHRLFCHITQNWRGTPLTSRSAVVELIASTTTKTGLKVRCELDTRPYAKGIKVSDDEMASLNITGDTFHPEWNYSIAPRRPP
ncbi:ISAzo13 family transposase [Mycobacterium sp.]|uniref:ISAzo13 family transposase n=1 Tax=Mycobacterium sp. TaxID=1785 RepID=UPI003F9D77E5